MTEPLKVLKEWSPLVATGLLMIIAFFMADKNQTLVDNTEAVHELTITVALNTATARLNTNTLSDLEDRIRDLEKFRITNN